MTSPCLLRRTLPGLLFAHSLPFSSVLDLVFYLFSPFLLLKNTCRLHGAPSSCIHYCCYSQGKQASVFKFSTERSYCNQNVLFFLLG